MQRILIVDDELKICEMLGKFFRHLGFAVESTTSPIDALKQVEQQRPDLLLLDVRMSPLSGLEVLRRVRHIDPNLRVIMVTAIDDDEIAQEALALGAIDYVTKPLSLNTKWWAERFFGLPDTSAPPPAATN